MSQIDPVQIRKVLHHQIPEFGSRGGGFGYAGHLIAFLILTISLALVGLVGAAFLCMTDGIRASSWDGFVVLLGFFALPTASYYAGKAHRREPHRALKTIERGWNPFSALLDWMVLKMYQSTIQAFLGPRRDRKDESELAISIVLHLIKHGATPTKDLVDSLAEQQIPRNLTSDTLRFLRKRKAIEPQEEFCKLSPYWGDLFPKPEIVF